MTEFAIDPTLPGGLPRDERGTVVTVGTFDGVHRGHWAVLQEIRGRATASGRRGVLLTFHPHPLRIVRPESAPRLLTTPTEKKEILAESGLDYAVFLSFTPVLARYSPQRFVEEILVRRLGVRELVIGYDHGFGQGRAGDVDTLTELGAALGFDVDVVAPVEEGGHAVSSSGIRRALAQGAVRAAAHALGRPYSIRGPIVRGDGRGRKLGFPTANIHVADPDKLIPSSGIYAVRGVLRCGTFAGALHLGPRPTFAGSAPTVELHLIDFAGDIYGEDVRVDFIERLREVRPFATVVELIQQMREDVELAREAQA
ncbi:MAG: bifunctional riboflavin kinase/FAD synthetase [Gemmatimonadetes bacterium]|nr:bifunctional riboflavin kinase/FAD synthetase [Gemmatimonadota bacterium]